MSSFDSIWCHGSLYSTSSDGFQQPSLVDVISGTIDLAVGCATSQCQDLGEGQGLDTLLRWPRSGVVTKASGRSASITYDDIVSRSLIANCKKIAMRENRKRKSDHPANRGSMFSEQLSSLTYGDIMSRTASASYKRNAKNMNENALKEDDEEESCYAYDCVARALVEHVSSPVGSELQKENHPQDPESKRRRCNDLITQILAKIKEGDVPMKVEQSIEVEPQQSIVISQPVELRATQELISIPDLMEESICCPESTSSNLKPRKSTGSRCLKTTATKVLGKPGTPTHGANRKQIDMESKATSTMELEPETEPNEAKVLYVSASVQTSRESLAFGETSDDFGLGICGIRQKQECDCFMERIFEGSDEDSKNPEKWLEVLSQWREKQLQESLSQTPLETQASEYFRGKSCSRMEMRRFLRKSRAEQMSRLNSVFQDLHLIEECLDRVNANEALDYVELTKELKASAVKLQKGSVTSQ